MVRNVAGGFLSTLGYRVEFASHGEEAVERYREAFDSGNPFPVVILDLTVPGGMGGSVAIQELRRIDPEVKAIVSSGYADDPIMTHYQDYGFSGVIKKPYRVDTFSYVLHEVLGQGEN